MKELYSYFLDDFHKQVDKKVQLARKTIEDHFFWKNTRQKTYQAIENIESEAMISCQQKAIAWVSSWNSKCGIANYSKLLLKQFMPGERFIFANDDAKYVQEDDNSVIRCWTSGAEDSLDNLYKNIISKDIEIAVFQFNFSFYSISEFAKLLNLLKQQQIKCYVFFHSTADVYWGKVKKSISDMQAALAECEALMVHSINDLNYLKTLGLVDNVILFPHGVSAQHPISTKLLEEKLLQGEYAKFQSLLVKSSNEKTINIAKADNSIIIAAYGFLLPHKGISNLICVFEQLKAEFPQLKLLLLNAIFPADISDQELDRCLALIANSNYINDIIMINDFLDEDVILAMLSISDYILFPYEHTQESSSAAVRMGLSLEKPIICTPLAIFDDVADVVHFLPGTNINEILKGMQELLKSESEKTQQLKLQKRWLEEHDWTVLSQRLKNILRV